MSCNVDGAVCERFPDAGRCSQIVRDSRELFRQATRDVLLGASLSQDPFPISPQSRATDEVAWHCECYVAKRLWEQFVCRKARPQRPSEDARGKAPSRHQTVQKLNRGKGFTCVVRCLGSLEDSVSGHAGSGAFPGCLPGHQSKNLQFSWSKVYPGKEHRRAQREFKRSHAHRKRLARKEQFVCPKAGPSCWKTCGHSVGRRPFF